MKSLVLRLSFLLLSTNIFSQSSFIPASCTSSTKDISKYINEHNKTYLEKISSAYAWVTANIQYDTDSSNQINLGINPEAKITEALRRRKGVCENFAAIFHDIISKVGITSVVIQGYTKQAGTVDRTGHSWVAVLLDNEWLLCDPTWDVASGSDPKYFLVKPGDFINTHMPFDPLWQLQNYPISHDQFYYRYSYSGKDSPFFNYTDSVQAYFKMDSLQRLKSSTSRIERAGTRNSLVKDNLNYNKMQIEMINQDKDIELYNSAVADLNDASKILNNFLNYRNTQFTPTLPDNEIKNLLSGIDAKLKSANKKLDEIDRSPATFAISSEPVRTRAKSLRNRYEEQLQFLNRYLELSKIERAGFFYK